MSSSNTLPSATSSSDNISSVFNVVATEIDQTTLLRQQLHEDPNTSTNVAVNIDSIDPQQALPPIRSMERSIHERTQSWRSSLSNVFQEIRPLVQHAQSVNNSNLFNSWMPASSGVGPTSSSSTSINGIARTSSGFRSDDFDANSAIPITHQNNLLYTQSGSQHGDSFIVNLDGHNSNISPTASSNIGYSNIHGNMRGTRTYNQARLASALSPLDTSTNSTVPPPPQHNHQHHHHRHHNEVITGNSLDGAPLQQPPPPPPPPPGEEVPTAEAIAQIPEARALLQSLMRYVPYICIILAKASYDMIDGILDLLALFITFSHANWVVRQEIGKQSQRCVMKLLRELIYIVLVVVVVGFMLEKKNIFISVIFANSFSDPFTLRHLLFSIAVTDLVLKLITVGVKIFITLLPPSIVEYKGRVSFVNTVYLRDKWFETFSSSVRRAEFFL